MTDKDGVVSFSADEAGAVVEDDVIVIGVRNRSDGQYFMLSRYLGGGEGEDERAVHVEFNDQRNSGYPKVERCAVSRWRLLLLTGPLEPGGAALACFVHLRIDDDAWHDLVRGLRRVFHGSEAILDVRAKDTDIA